jgi:opacity protein-like surface antigen
MRRFAAPACALGVALAAARARAEIPFNVTVTAGWTLPVSPSALTDGWNGGPSIAAGIQHRLSSRLQAWFEVGYHRLGFDTQAFDASIASAFPNVHTSGNALWILPVHAGVDFALTSWGNTRPYLTAGVGYDHVGHTTPQASGPGASGVTFPEFSGGGFGIRIGAGVRTLLSPSVSLFIDASWHEAWVSPEAITFVPLRVGLRF